MLAIAKTAPFKEDVKRYLEWAVRMTTRHRRITVHLSREATVDRVTAENPDALIVATGAKPLIPPIPGIDQPHVVWGGDVEAGKKTVGQNVVVAGGGMTGCETALHLARQGKTVTLVEMLPRDQMIGNAPKINMLALVDLLETQQVDIRNDTKLTVIERNKVMIESNGRPSSIPCDSIVLCLGMVPDQEMADRFIHCAPDVYLVGDSTTARGNVWVATRTAFHAAISI